MITDLEEKLPVVSELCRQYRVERLEVFGSAARAIDARSVRDLDLIVRFAQPGGDGYADRYLAFAEALERIFGKRVDLLTERSIRNPVFRRAVDRDRQLLYAAA